MWKAKWYKSQELEVGERWGNTPPSPAGSQSKKIGNGDNRDRPGMKKCGAGVSCQDQSGANFESLLVFSKSATLQVFRSFTDMYIKISICVSNYRTTLHHCPTWYAVEVVFS